MIEEERELAYKMMADQMIFMAKNDSIRIGLMLKFRPLGIKDTIYVPQGDVEILISSPDADPYHLLTLMVNDEAVAVKRATKQQALRVKINTVEFPGSNIYFLCEHALVSVYYNTEITVKSGDNLQKIVIPVSTYQNAGFYLQAEKKPDVP
jgi:hypothetical protein